MVSTTLNNAQYFPWNWTITSIDPAVHQCPPASSLLGTFAAVNGIVSVIAVIFGHRIILQKISCGMFGKKGSRAWTYMWLLPVGLQLSANAIIAAVIKRTAGYHADFKIWQLMLFLVARPRLSWIVLGGFAFQARKPSRKRSEPLIPVPYASPGFKASSPSLQPYGSVYSMGSYDQSSYSVDHLLQTSPNPSIYAPATTDDTSDDYPWWSAFMSQFIGEFMLQTIALYIMGLTAHFASGHGYYEISKRKLYHSLPHGAHMMYAGALYYLVAGSGFLLFASLFIFFNIRASKYIAKANTPAIVLVLVLLLVSTWMGSWIFWAGFVKLAGNLYCPPKLIHQGVIWIIFSTIGIVLGAGM
ncbi:hypothetical protein K432DRAFT_335237 [Lepidopterella palustris CBS 459.81]|uniref:Uncharacterized protein n=1 Tax=Lepidopterella palustris CBS 459.81 TaxID=1314670 RepID=A0A8E2E3K0_9PEZI|nr:hypothetical protein K432DRAFT_335237 [Lepidopterella palustris CBS 459.81]